MKNSGGQRRTAEHRVRGEEWTEIGMTIAADLTLPNCTLHS